MDLAEYNKVKNYSYHEYCNYLKDKYGRIFGAYFSPSGYKNRDITRTKDGLYIHHIFEDHAIMLGNFDYARNNPFEWQLGRNLVYCDLLEHMFLHILISENPPEDANPNEDVGVGGVANFIVPELNDLYSGWITKQDWRLKCHLKVIGSKDLYFVLIKRFNDAFKKHPTYKSHWYVSSMNAQMNPGGDWKLSDDKEIINDIAELLGESKPIKEYKENDNIDSERKHINIDDIDFGDYKCFTKKELNKIYNYIKNHYETNDCTINMISNIKDILGCFEIMIESEIAELTNVIVVHVLENHQESPAIYSLTLSLAKQIVAYNMYKSGNLDEDDILFYISECYGYYASHLQENLQKKLGFDIHFYIDECLETFNNLFSDFSLDIFKVSSEELKNSEFNWVLDDPFIFVADYRNEDKWDSLCDAYLDPLPVGLNLYSFLNQFSNPFSVYPWNRETINNAMHYIINKLIYEALKVLNIEEQVKHYDEGPKQYYTVLKKEDSMGVYERSQLDKKDSNLIANFFNSSSDHLHEQIVLDVFALYLSVYLCHEMCAYSTSIQLYEIFCNWIATFYNFDVLPLAESKKELQFFDEISDFILCLFLSPNSDDRYADALCNRFKKYAEPYFQSHYAGNSKVATLDDFYHQAIATFGTPYIYRDTCKQNVYNFLVMHEEDLDYKVCRDTYDITKFTTGMNISVYLGPQINFQDLSLYLSLTAIESMNKILRDYMECLVRHAKGKEAKEFIKDCATELNHDAMNYHNYAVSLRWTFRKDKKQNK